MYCKKQIQKLIKNLTTEDLLKSPTQEEKNKWLEATSIQLLDNCLNAEDYTTETKVDVHTAEYFGYCWRQVASYSNSYATAIDIGVHTGIPPIVIAVYMDTYGYEWATKLFEAKRIVRKPRGKFTILRMTDVYATVGQISRILERVPFRVPAFSKMIEDGSMVEAQMILQTYPVSKAICSLALNVQIFVNPKLKGEEPEHRTFKTQTHPRHIEMG